MWHGGLQLTVLLPNDRVQLRCGAQRSNVGCNPVLARPLQLWSSKLPLHSVALSNYFFVFPSMAR
jgi:hypothetical protein